MFYRHHKSFKYHKIEKSKISDLCFKMYAKNHKIKVFLKLHVTRRCGNVFLGVDALGVCELFLCLRDV